MGAESWFTGLTQSSSGSLIQPTPPSPLVTNLPSNWIKVPQKSYDHGRKQWNFRRSEPISFHVNGRPGINMGDALRKVFAGLDGRDDPALQDPPGTISCRLLVGLSWFSIRPLKSTIRQVPWVSGQQQFVPGMSTEPITLPGTDHRMKDSCTGLD